VATLVAALVSAACGSDAGQAPVTSRPVAARSASTANTAACYAFAVSALRRHVIVRRTPPECAGLGATQVNDVVGRAIRTVAGPLPKAAARRQDLADSHYLASLIRQGRPPRPASLAVGPAAASGTFVARLAALAAWLAAAIAGGYLLIGRRRRSRRRGPIRALGLPYGHAGLAATGLCIWIGFMVTAVPALGWIDVALTWVVVGLGMATLLGDGPASPPETVPAPAAATASGLAPAARASGRAPVLVIALHGALAAVTILLVLLAVIGTG
jgi:manganese efflux pump family protein